jgi:serine/threonine-protein kinase
MPYVEGDTLRDKLNREKQLSVDETVAIATSVAAALDYAHEQGLIHRDIKPENILLQRGQAVVADFGIALAVHAGEEARLTETGLSIGTPHYMSPEQAAGERELDGRSDQYALACVVYEMLAGEPPFTGPTAQAVIAKHVSQTAPQVTTVRSSVPSPLGRVLTRALAKTPTDRFTTLSEFSGALTQALSEKTALYDDASTPEKSIAVLPFENMSGSPDDEYFSDGMTEEIINALTQIPELKVTARTSVFAFKGKHGDVRQVAGTLGVAKVLDGTVRRAGNRVRVTAQLINARDGYHEWSERFDREMDDVFALQDDIARCIAERFQVVVQTPAERPLVMAPTTNLDAYELYLRGRFAWERLDMSGARGYFEQALRIDPDYALAHVGLAMMYNLANSAGLMPPKESGPLAQEEAERALAIDDGLAEAHTELAWTAMAYHWDWEAAERECLRALELNPRYFNAHRVYATVLGFVHGRFDDALSRSTIGLEIDPLNPLLLMDRGFLLAAKGRFEDVVNLLQPLVDDQRATVIAMFILALSYVQLGRRKEATRVTAHIEEATKGSPGFGHLADLVEISAAREVDSAVQDRYRKTIASRDEGYVQALGVAWVAAAAGEIDEAFEWLDQAYEERDGIMWLLKYHPASAPLRSDARFDAFLERVGFPSAKAVRW